MGGRRSNPSTSNSGYKASDVAKHTTAAAADRFTSTDMFSSTIAVVGAALPVALALTPLESFYPPNLNDTAYISDSSIGTYGGIYQAPTRNNENTGSPYGSYDYCTMPHPRTTEYELPEPVKNGSVRATLVYLEYLQRHQRRTPYNILPGGEVDGRRPSSSRHLADLI